MRLFTIGVYGSSEEEFFNKLLTNDIDLFIDIRRRRGVRGSKYAFVNSIRLQKKLDDMGISYLHEIYLSPTKEVREVQKKVDMIKNIQKRKRHFLSQEFRDAFSSEIIATFNFDDFIKVNELQTKNIVLFCVEKTPLACHRSYVAEKMQALDPSLVVKHL
jgi:uncharacterized protein (DUF488 family)